MERSDNHAVLDLRGVELPNLPSGSDAPPAPPPSPSSPMPPSPFCNALQVVQEDRLMDQCAASRVEGGDENRSSRNKKHRKKKKPARSGVRKSRSRGHSLQCRICMDSVSERDFVNEKALRLGCKCTDGLDVTHTSCARKWFKIRKNTTCEICEEEAIGLPKPIRKEIREVARRAMRDSLQETSSRFHIPLRSYPRTHSEELHLCTYTTFCLLPAALSAIFMVFFYFESLKLDVVQTMVLAITVSSATMIHWLVEPNRPVWHMVFVFMFVGFIMGLSYMFACIQRWGSLSACIYGAVTGALFSVGVYTAIRAAVALIAFPDYRSSFTRTETNSTAENSADPEDSIV
ncbi:hypothetical protein BSKO_00957 [Bryopsis sp. KO-2023]|nr:hypothetical protein BSKO_00957 [Bryopsis sp. KO-2023]